MVLQQYELLSGGKLEVTPEHMYFKFARARTAISTSEYLGGINKLAGVFNQLLPEQIYACSDLPGGSVPAYFALRAQQLGHSCMSGLLTSAHMQCHGHSFSRSEELSVEVFATAGVEGNAARAGEPAQYRETKDGFAPIGGTINIFVFFSFALPPGLLAKALLTVTEAKSTLLQEYGIYSTFSDYTATGTSTDGVIIVMEDKGEQYHDIGTHCQLGQLLAANVKQAVAQALNREGYLSRHSQLLPQLLLGKLAKEEVQYAHLKAKFANLSLHEQEQIKNDLNIWLLLKEKNAFGGLPDKVFANFTCELLVKNPLLKEFMIK